MRDNYLRSCCRSKMSLFICTPQQIPLRLAEDIDLIDQTGLSRLPAKVSSCWHLFGSLWAQVKHYSCSIIQPSGYTAHNTTSTRSSGEMTEVWENKYIFMHFMHVYNILCYDLGFFLSSSSIYALSLPLYFFTFHGVLSAYVCLCLNVLETLWWCTLFLQY